MAACLSYSLPRYIILLLHLFRISYKKDLGRIHLNIVGNEHSSRLDIFSGLDKDLDQWVFHPLLFNLMSILLHF